MYNYNNLNDVEFEALCKDIMEKKLNTSLRIFTKGRDGGIDLVDNVSKPNSIVQVKHYIRSSYASLRRSLKNEINNVVKLNPNQYFLCIGMELTPANIKEIFEMFSQYMESDRNIITLKEIDEFLETPDNSDIVRKHYKLWLYASNILNEVYNQDTFIDCDVLLDDIEEECKYFVQTDFYFKCIDHLDKHGLLMITGGPGVGKTMTSKLIVLFYAWQGYKVRYTTNGEVSNIKRSISRDKDLKEIILLDDCLGQHYFNMKVTQESELLSLIKYIKTSRNKKLILNSRVTIFSEAKGRSFDFNKFFKEKEINDFTINMDNITDLEKARILYNHLKYKLIPEIYYNDILKDKNYLKIVQHKNYNPRIIDYVTYRFNYEKILPDEYYNYIEKNLSNPNDVWKNEFEMRIQPIDRAFMFTLYSLTDTQVEKSILKKCFERRIATINNIDYSIDHFENILTRLNQSLINIIDKNGKMFIGVVNPSVNDYMSLVFKSNQLLVDELKDSIIHYKQIEKCFKKDDFTSKCLQLMESGQINNIDFQSNNEKNYFIAAHICKFKIKDSRYKQNIFDYLNDSYGKFDERYNWKAHVDILDDILDRELFEYYSIEDFILNETRLKSMLDGINFDLLIHTIKSLLVILDRNGIIFDNIIQEIIDEAVLFFVEDISILDYCGEFDINTLISEYTDYYDSGYDVDTDSIVIKLKNSIIDQIQDEVFDQLSVILNINLDKITEIISGNISDYEIESYVESYFKVEEDYEHYNTKDSSTFEIEIIFER